MATVDIAVVKAASGVDDIRLDEAENALEQMDNQLNHNFVVDKKYNDNYVDQVKCGDRSQTVRNCEDALENDGILGNNEVIVLLHGCSNFFTETMGVAGIAFWPAGATNATNSEGQNRRYESSAGQYAFAFVNVNTRKAPYNEGYFKNTVIHETGHTLMDNVDGNTGPQAEHLEGSIFSDDQASPMCTWYVESRESVYVENEDLEYTQPGNLCAVDG
ncbi:MAG: hypothetical protein ABEI99_13175, partial [Halobaculum sp.]